MLTLSTLRIMGKLKYTICIRLEPLKRFPRTEKVFYTTSADMICLTGLSFILLKSFSFAKTCSKWTWILLHEIPKVKLKSCIIPSVTYTMQWLHTLRNVWQVFSNTLAFLFLKTLKKCSHTSFVHCCFRSISGWLKFWMELRYINS